MALTIILIMVCTFLSFTVFLSKEHKCLKGFFFCNRWSLKFLKPNSFNYKTTYSNVKENDKWEKKKNCLPRLLPRFSVIFMMSNCDALLNRVRLWKLYCLYCITPRCKYNTIHILTVNHNKQQKHHQHYKNAKYYTKQTIQMYSMSLKFHPLL